MNAATKRTWAEISLCAFEHNVSEFRRTLPENTKILGVVKANAYGHGAPQVAQRLEKIGADYLAVACLDEAVELRRAGIQLPILILGATPAEYASELAEDDITQEVECLEKAKALSANLLPGQKLKVHIKLDTGMGRIGFRAREESQLLEAEEAMKLPNLIPEGCFMHFCVSDEPETQEAFTRGQYELFIKATDKLQADTGIRFAIRHCANSGCTLYYPEYALNMVRPGIALYGLYPGKSRGKAELHPTMELKTRICAVTHHVKGESVGYGRTWIAPRDVTLAVIPIGYADGLHRSLSNKMEVLVHGQRARQVGRICMDVCMVDITDIPDVQVGDIVTIFGHDGEAYLSVTEQAELAGTIDYELLCAVAPRVPRVYVD